MQLCEPGDRRRIGRASPKHQLGRRELSGLVGRHQPVAHRHDHERGPATRLCLMEGAGDRPGYILGAHRLVDPDRVVAGEPVQPPGEEGLEREVPTILLADEHDDRRPIHPSGRERCDRVPETGRRVQDGERRLPSADREAGRHADDGALVQPEHEAKVGREIREERHLGRPRIREHRCQAESAKDVERRIPHRSPAYRLPFFRAQAVRRHRSRPPAFTAARLRPGRARPRATSHRRATRSRRRSRSRRR